MFVYQEKAVSKLSLIFLFVIFSTNSEPEIKFINKPVKEINQNLSKEDIENITAGATYSATKCMVANYKEFYSIDDIEKQATRDFIEKRKRLYVVPGGYDPIYPKINDNCSIKYEEKTLLWPTKGCNVDLTYEYAINYASKYNESIIKKWCTLKSRSGVNLVK